MEEEFNINEVIGSFLSHKINDIGSIASKSFKKISNEISIKLQNKYSVYLRNIANRYGKTRTFFIRDDPKPLYQFYEPIGIECETKRIENASITEIVDVNTRILIQGSGGAGKSVLLKHLLLNSLKTNYKVPVFLELRDSNHKEQVLTDLISKSFKEFKLDLEDDYLIRALEEGHFIIFLDGLDEVKNSLRSDLIKDIEEFSKTYSNCTYVISTRPDDKITEFELFTFFQTLPLTLNQSISLIEKLPAEEEIKEKFIEDLKTGLFEKHNSFLSNPLLLSIMLLTYGYSADIPNKLSIFYNQAYEALFQRHDALKGAYKRDRESSLDIIAFERVLSSFCILTYDDRKFQFSRIEAMKYISNGSKLVGVSVQEDQFLNDLMQAVCFLIQDGLFLTFTHRSFQEYFTAKFIANSNNPTVKKKLLKKFFPDMWRDNIYSLVYELDPVFFETEIIIPFLDDLFGKVGLKTKVGKMNYLKFCRILFQQLSLEDRTHSSNAQNEDKKLSLVTLINDSQIFHMIQIILDEVSNMNSIKKFEYGSSRSIEKEIISDFEKGLLSMPIDFKKLKTTDLVFEKIYDCNSFHSSKTLKYLWEVKEMLINKHQVINDDLEKLLQNNTSNKH
ncbi:NACHT domain-containing protein [Marinoscillum furvescens]|uniref:NACHT domain-containing protein n=1 Tax=Marinoscillum furvescens DSM 4134 TaxID=1122208 RepID=A0A3D9KWF5_MARFU|nr:NACHT domain-containing protein [Marinoscillum furvescens]RED91231.1 NACHT domain-containing protein [Marinoscillum furvescens DSM 4134]